MYDRSRSSATDSIDVARLGLCPKTEVICINPSNTSSPYSTYKVCWIPSRLHMRAKELYVKWKPTALRTEVGRSKVTCGKSFGQHFRQLLRVAISLRSSTARRNAVADTSAIALVFLAHLCVAAIVTAKIHSKFDLTR